MASTHEVTNQPPPLVDHDVYAGDLALAEGGVAGTLDLSRGGVDGTIALSTRAGGQAFDVDLALNNARFGGATPLVINQGRIDATGFIGDGSWTVEGETRITGLGYGNIFLRRVAAQAEITNGRGTFDAAIEKLDHLVDLGVDAVELLPVNAFGGERGWGYDGVDLYAVHHPYGGPDGLKRFAHQYEAFFFDLDDPAAGIRIGLQRVSRNGPGGRR